VGVPRDPAQTYLDTDLRVSPNAQHEPDVGEVREEQLAPPVLAPAPAPPGRPAPMPESLPVPRLRAAVRDRLNAPTQAVAPILNRVVRPPPPVDNEQLRRLPPPADHSRQPGPSTSTSNPAPAASPHFRSQSLTMVAPMRLSPTRAPTEPLADDLPEPGSDFYFRHDDIDAAFLSRAASELERSEATLAQSSQQSFPPPSQPRREVFFVDDDDDDKENTLVRPRVARQTGSRQIVSDGSVIEIVDVVRIRPPRMDNDDDVISIGSDD